MVLNKKTKGIMCILGAAFFFALMNMFVRMSGELPSIQKSFFRNFIALIVATVILLKNPGSVKSARGNWPLLILRAGFGTVGILCNFYAIDHMNISDATMLNKLSPFFAIILSYIFLKEKAGIVQWIGVVTAFLGSLLIIKPTFNADMLPALIGTLGGFGAGVAYTAVRKLGSRGVKGPMIVFFFSLFSCGVTMPSLILDFVPMSGEQLMLLICAGLSAAGGQFCITAAYTFAPAKEISVFDYSQVVFAALLGFVFLGQVPDGLSIIGYVIICMVAVIMWWHQKDRKVKV